MKTIINIYISTFLISLLSVLTGCTDEILYDDNPAAGNPDRISFTGTVGNADEFSTRGGGPLYEALVLNGETVDFPLFLHTWEHPLDENLRSGQTDTRGLQVANAKDLYDIHQCFAVQAAFEEDASTYIAMAKTKMLSVGDNRIWTTEHPNRWPGEKRLCFNAIAPYDHISALHDVEFGKNSISFSYQALKGDGTNDAEKQVDLLTAVSTLNRAEAKPYHYRIPLKFKHALSAVKFAVRDVVKGKVVKITINGVYGKADCIYSADDDSGNGAFSWSNHSQTDTFSQIFNHEIEDGKFNPDDSTGDVLLNNAMPEKTFMLIPQIIPDDATIEVEIERYDVAQRLPSTIKVSGKIKDNSLKEWKAGHEYVYTISTSKDNWVYVFDAQGNEAGGSENIFVYSPNDPRFDNSGNIAEFYVKSYRYRANDQNYIEPLPWKASHDGSYSYLSSGASEYPYPADNPDSKYVSAQQWISDTFETPLEGKGSVELEEHCLDMLPHYLSTNWPGDREMQAHLPYSGFDKENPYDLSTFGGKIQRTTANCYVVDRGGWYMFPLVYGNAIKDGKENTQAYICQNTSDAAKKLPVLRDYNDQPISGAYIQNVVASAAAMLIWEDAYQLAEQVELVTINGERMIRFYVEPNDIQQGNAIVALTDTEDGTVMWSWHIWATEHWLNPDPGIRLPHAFDPESNTFNSFTPSPSKEGIRQRGDVAITHNQHGRKFMMAPYNLGWCDPKQVTYLKRKATMTCKQFMPDGYSPTGRTAELPIIQDGEVVDYRFGNNTYYQWGRKDPMCGFINHDQQRKAVFGPRLYTIKSQDDISIGKSIQNPQVFYGKSGRSWSQKEDWLRWGGYQNLWNNHAKSSMDENLETSYQEDLWCHTKTVYDPCPAGYMVPNAGIWRFTYASMDISLKENNFDITQFQNNLNGQYIDDYNYKVWGNGVPSDNNAIFFSSTGNIWWTDDEPIMEKDKDGNVILEIKGGDNFGRNVSYAWSNRFVNAENHYMAYGLALGLDTNLEEYTTTRVYFLGAQFKGRRALGRPVRAIREPENP